MAKALLLYYIIGITVFMFFPSCIAIAAVLGMDDATWRTWAELIRGLATGWLFFAAPALVLYVLIVLLPQILTHALQRKGSARQQAALQARARALNPQNTTTATNAHPTGDGNGTSGSHTHTEDSPQSADNHQSAAETQGTRESDAIEDYEAHEPYTAAQRLSHYLLDTEPVASTLLWRLLVSVLIFPLLACTFFSLMQIAAELGTGQRAHFSNELIGTLLLSVYLSFLPMPAYWLVTELLLRLRPLWFASRLRHVATGALLGTLALLCIRWLDPSFSEFPLSPLSLWQALLLGACSGTLLAVLYRIPVQWNLATD